MHRSSSSRSYLPVWIIVWRIVILAFVAMALLVGKNGAAGPSKDKKEVQDGENAPWTCGVGKVRLEMSLPEAREIAIRRARNDAIEKGTAEIVVRTVDHLAKESSQEGDEEYIHERYVRLIHCEVGGRIIEEREPIFDFVEDDSGEPALVCSLWARVAPEKEERDPAFVLKINLLDDNGIERKTFRDGDEVVLRIRSSKDCYLNIFNVYSEGDVRHIFPNDRMPARIVPAGSVIEIPSVEDRDKREIHFRLNTLPDRERCMESIHVIATKHEVSFISGEKTPDGSRYISTYKSAFDELNRWLMNIPPDERTEAVAFYWIAK